MQQGSAGVDIVGGDGEVQKMEVIFFEVLRSSIVVRATLVKIGVSLELSSASPITLKLVHFQRVELTNPTLVRACFFFFLVRPDRFLVRLD